MFPYMVSGDDENPQPSPDASSGGPGPDSAGEANSERHAGERLKSQQIKPEVTAAAAVTSEATSSETRPEADSKSGPKPPRSLLLKKVTEAQKKTSAGNAASSGVRKERDEIKEVRVEELHTTDQATAATTTTTASKAKTATTTSVESTREEIVTVELKRQGLQKREGLFDPIPDPTRVVAWLSFSNFPTHTSDLKS